MLFGKLWRQLVIGLVQKKQAPDFQTPALYLAYFLAVKVYSSTAACAAANKPWLSVFYKFSVRDFSIFGTQTACFYMHIWTVLH